MRKEFPVPEGTKHPYAPAPAAGLGLIRYDRMITAIAECRRVDEVKDMRDKARALEVYAQQAQNREAERKAREIRIRAERKTGELLKETRRAGKTQKQGRPLKKGRNSRPLIEVSRNMPEPEINSATLKDLGITKDQSSQWQQLADVPQKDFEAALAEPTGTATTEGIVNAQKTKDNPVPKIDPDALYVWGRLREFEKLFHRDINELIAGMPETMRESCIRILPLLLEWLEVTRGSHLRWQALSGQQATLEGDGRSLDQAADEHRAGAA
jgi:hypothetical protein